MSRTTYKNHGLSVVRNTLHVLLNGLTDCFQKTVIIYTSCKRNVMHLVLRMRAKSVPSPREPPVFLHSFR